MAASPMAAAVLRPDRLGEDVRGGDAAQFAPHGRRLLDVRHHPDVVPRRHDGRESSDRFAAAWSRGRRYSTVAWECACDCEARNAFRVLRPAARRRREVTLVWVRLLHGCTSRDDVARSTPRSASRRQNSSRSLGTYVRSREVALVRSDVIFTERGGNHPNCAGP